MHAHETTSSQLTNGSYSRRCERAVGLEELALATLPPDLCNKTSTDFENPTIGVHSIRMRDGEHEGRDKFGLKASSVVHEMVCVPCV